MNKRAMFYGSRPETFRKAAMLRNNETKAEKVLWERLRNNQLRGFRFKRQHPIADYVADFYCHQLKLVIEIDEAHHLQKQQQLHDTVRTETLNHYGLTVIRFRDEEILETLEQVLVDINNYIDQKIIR